MCVGLKGHLWNGELKQDLISLWLFPEDILMEAQLCWIVEGFFKSALHSLNWQLYSATHISLLDVQLDLVK